MSNQKSEFIRLIDGILQHSPDPDVTNSVDRLQQLIAEAPDEQARDEAADALRDEARRLDFSEMRAPVPGPIDPELFSKSAEEVSDGDFFEIIWDNHAYLGAAFSVQKIEQWRKDIYSYNKDKAYTAKELLKRIGTTLARAARNPGQGTKYKEPSIPPWQVRYTYQMIYEDLSNNNRSFDGRNEVTRIRKLKKYSEDVLGIVLHDKDITRLQQFSESVSSRGRIVAAFVAADLVDNPPITFTNRIVAAFIAAKLLDMQPTTVLGYIGDT